MKHINKIGYVDGGVLLPVYTISTMKGYDGEATLRNAGVVFHEPLVDDRRFRLAELPPGWTVVEVFGPSEGEKLNLLDGKGRVRATVRQIYGWLPWTRMTVACPFIISFRGEREGKLVGRIRMRYGGEIMSLPPTTLKRVRRPDNFGCRVYKRQKTGEMKAEKIASMQQWLDEALPDWKTNSKHWDYQKVA